MCELLKDDSGQGSAEEDGGTSWEACEERTWTVARAEPHGPGAASSERNDDTIPVRRNQTLPKHVPNELLDLAHCAIKPTNMPALGVRA